MKVAVYRFLNKYWKEISSALITYIITALLDHLFDIDSTLVLSGVSAVVLVVVWISYAILRKIMVGMRIPKQFHKVMVNNSAETVKNIDKYIDIFWGEDAILNTPEDIICGYKPDVFSIVHYDDSLFRFDDEYQNEYNSYLLTDNSAAIIKRHDNMPRYMVESYQKNHNPKDPVINIRLKRTDFLQNLFAREVYKSGKEDKILRILYNESFIWSNSFCLHLIVQTKDDKIVLGKTAVVKSDDYPGTWAATIGEQIERTDFCDNKGNIRDDFVDRWIRRAVSEEFGITGSENFDEVFDSDSARILGLTFEADIGNYSLPVIINTKQRAEDFEREISETIQREEIGEYKMIDVDEIPAILVRYNDNKSKYHPST